MGYTAMIRVTLPPAFYWDHRWRDLPSGEVVKETSRGVVVDLDREALDDLYSDAQHCVRSAHVLGPEQRGLVASARATIRKLNAAAIATPSPK